MDYRTLGSSGLSVSPIGIGCGRFGRDDPTKLDEAAATELIDRAIDLGVNFFDTANAYADGQSEEILGAALAGYDREFPVVASKVYYEMDETNPNASGLSRKAIEHALENSLDRLGMDTIDLYQIHRWDESTPIRETLSALTDAVRRGQVRYLGASSMYAYQFATALYTSDQHELDRFISMQNHYNLVYREEEREMLPLCQQEGIGAIPWSPLARGFLARPRSAVDATPRGKQFVGSDRLEVYRSRGGEEINKRLDHLADEHGVSMAQLALAWVLGHEAVDAVIVGMSSIEHLEEAVAATELSLSSRDREYLEEPYEPKPISGHT